MADTDMLKRVAEAIRRKSVEIERRRAVNVADAVTFAEDYARAVIEAMREPTEEMLATKEAIDMSATTDAIWPAMIDVILAEKPPRA